MVLYMSAIFQLVSNLTRKLHSRQNFFHKIRSLSYLIFTARALTGIIDPLSQLGFCNHRGIEILFSNNLTCCIDFQYLFYSY